MSDSAPDGRLAKRGFRYGTRRSRAASYERPPSPRKQVAGVGRMAHVHYDPVTGRKLPKGGRP